MRTDRIALALLLVACCRVALGQGTVPDPAVVTWVTIQDDDGSMEGHWGASLSPAWLVCKRVDLGIDPGQVKGARITYRIGCDVYHLKMKKHFDNPGPGVEWADMRITLNGNVVAERPGIDLATRGWHTIEADPRFLRKGENRIVFTWAPLTGERQKTASYGYFYVGIDTDAKTRLSCASSDGGKTFSSDDLRPGRSTSRRWQGEYMIRLEIALPNG